MRPPGVRGRAARARRVAGWAPPWLALGVFVVLALAPARVAAHALGPSSLQIEERAPGVASVRFQAPTAAALVPRWPDGCAATVGARRVEGANTVEQFELTCARGLAGSVIGVDGLPERDTIALVRVRLADGRVAREVLGPSRPRFTVPPGTSWAHVAATYGWLGVEHLLGGLDHVLFVLGLMLVVPGLRARAITLTAFTAGHSLTLGLAVLGLVRVPEAPVEVLIALTLLAIAIEAMEPGATRRERRSSAPDPLEHRSSAWHRRTWIVAAVFGLAHGFGFAGALAGAGMPADDVPLALAAFNLGIEVGQLALVAAAMLIVVAATSLTRRTSRLAPRARIITAYAIGALAAMWCLERTWAVWTS